MLFRSQRGGHLFPLSIASEGSAEIGGSLEHKREASVQTLYKVLQDWFPGAAQINSGNTGVQVWKGARPMLPDGPPVIGSAGMPGLWLNLGHGSSGWALSCGSARLLADMLAGKTPPLMSEKSRSLIVLSVSSSGKYFRYVIEKPPAGGPAVPCPLLPDAYG